MVVSDIDGEAAAEATAGISSCALLCTCFQTYPSLSFQAPSPSNIPLPLIFSAIFLKWNP